MLLPISPIFWLRSTFEMGKGPFKSGQHSHKYHHRGRGRKEAFPLQPSLIPSNIHINLISVERENYGFKKNWGLVMRMGITITTTENTEITEKKEQE